MAVTEPNGCHCLPKYVSTRGSGPATFAQALSRGLAPDGGLYVPVEPPRLPTGAPPTAATLSETARWASRTMLSGDLDPAVADRVVREALDFPVPLVEVERGTFVLELFHGPSAAFKDVGARFLARAMQATSTGGGARTVLVATSGDTGGAVAAAFHGMEGYSVVALFPADGVTERQRRQMSTLGGNVLAVAVAGSFDDCQRLAKGAFGDATLGDRCGLTSANSINLGRLLPQLFYYGHAAAQLGWSAAPATFAVPSGNLGNLCAGLLAQDAGIPVQGFVAAVNANRMLLDYLTTGQATPRSSRVTLSSAMDVGDPSNLERIRWLHDDDVDRLRARVAGYAATDDETMECMASVFRRTGYVLDPHTAVGWRAMERMRTPEGSVAGAGGAATSPRVVLATAHPWKFPDAVREATGTVVAPPPGLAALGDTREHVVHIPPDPGALRSILLNPGR